MKITVEQSLLGASFVNAVVYQSWPSVCVLLLASSIYLILSYLAHNKTESELSVLLRSIEVLERKQNELERIVSTSSLGQAFRPTRK